MVKLGINGLICIGIKMGRKRIKLGLNLSLKQLIQVEFLMVIRKNGTAVFFFVWKFFLYSHTRAA